MMILPGADETLPQGGVLAAQTNIVVRQRGWTGSGFGPRGCSVSPLSTPSSRWRRHSPSIDEERPSRAAAYRAQFAAGCRLIDLG